MALSIKNTEAERLARELARERGTTVTRAVIGALDPAGLNLGDCCAYALARHAGEPLLFKGDEFPRTDVVPVVRERLAT